MKRSNKNSAAGNPLGLFVMGLAFLCIAGIAGSFYVIDETQQAVITQFGKPIGEPITKAGLYFKIPVIQTVNRFEKRLLQWDGDPKEVPTIGKRFILVDTTARWRIENALKYMQAVGTESLAQSRLDDIIEGATINAITSSGLADIIRNSNELIVRQEKEAVDFDKVFDNDIEPVKTGRELITRKILEVASKDAEAYGIRLVDVRIKRINYKESVQNKVYERMVSERKQAAEQFRSEGQGKKAEIEGQVAKELEEIRSEAYRTAEEIKGKADAEAIKIYADAYNKDPEFYSFIKSLETYQTVMNEDTTLMLDADSELLRFLKSAQ